MDECTCMCKCMYVYVCIRVKGLKQLGDLKATYMVYVCMYKSKRSEKSGDLKSIYIYVALHILCVCIYV